MKWELILLTAILLIIDVDMFPSQGWNRVALIQKNSSGFATSSLSMRAAEVTCNKGNGIYAHPQTTSKYILCRKDPSSGRAIYFEFDCPAETTFDAGKKRCVIEGDSEDPCIDAKIRRGARGGDNELARAGDDIETICS